MPRKNKPTSRVVTRESIAPRRRHYIVALTSNLGTRYAYWRLPALGAAIDATMAAWLEYRP